MFMVQLLVKFRFFIQNYGKESLYKYCMNVDDGRIMCSWHSCLFYLWPTTTVVKELRSKMFGQHPGYFKAVFLKQTRIIIVSIYKYIVYIMF